MPYLIRYETMSEIASAVREKISVLGEIYPSDIPEYIRNINIGEGVNYSNVKYGIFVEDNSLYYYENGERAYVGLIRIGNEYYYAKTSGELVVGRSYWITKTNDLLPERSFDFNDKGILQKDGIFSENNSRFYYNNGVLDFGGLIKINYDYYYATETGELAIDCEYQITKHNDLMPEGVYEFDAIGRLKKNGIFSEDNLLWYYKDGKKNFAGLLNIDGNYYYAKQNGELIISRSYWITKTNDLLPEGSYMFDNEGKLVLSDDEGTSTKNGIVAEDNSLYYYENGVRTYAGLIQIGNYYYYVKTTGELVVGRDYWITKPNGLLPEGMYTFDDEGKMIIADVSKMSDDIVSEAKRVVNINSTGNIKFIAISDMHEISTSDTSDTSIIECYQKANVNAGQATEFIASIIKPMFYANLGDLAWGGDNTSLSDGISSIESVKKYTNNILNYCDSFYVPGNHDPLGYSFLKNKDYLDYDEIQGLIGTYQYKDYEDNKLRVICLNTADNYGLSITNNTGIERISGTQLLWFASSLDLSDKEDASEWSIIILSHHPLDWGAIIPAANCLQAYLTGGVFSSSHDGAKIYYDYKGKNLATVIAQFHGHTHCFKTDYINHNTNGVIEPTTVKRIAIPNACYARSNEYGENLTTNDSNGIEFGEKISFEKIDNSTGKNTSFCVISINTNTKMIYVNCYGAGYNRVISYGDNQAIMHKITCNFTNLTNNNNITTIANGTTYFTNLILNSNYVLNSIIITMNGEDITSNVYFDNIINIPNVTGNVVITASAISSTGDDEDDEVYTNLVPTSVDTDLSTIFNSVGYKNGAYASNEHYGTDENCVTTGFINLPSNVTDIYIKGATWDISNGHCRIHFFRIPGDTTTLNYSVKANETTDNVEIVSLGDNYYKITIIKPQIQAAECWYCVSLVGTGENLIITHDEPIN